jgi:hypothetical protein
VDRYPVIAVAGRGRVSIMGWKKNKLIVYPLELIAGVGIVAWMAVSGLARVVTLPRDWARYKKIRSI